MVGIGSLRQVPRGSRAADVVNHGLHANWLAVAGKLHAAGVILGTTANQGRLPWGAHTGRVWSQLRGYTQRPSAVDDCR
jgi:hypothetical protein